MSDSEMQIAIEREEDRYSRLRLIPWWDQKKIQTANVLVVGAGALGNEILKNLALLGFRNIVIVDLDRIELTNLSRAVLFREDQIGESKADVAARGFRALQEDSFVRALNANVVLDCGLGLFAWSDVIIAGLDNREARLWINRCLANEPAMDRRRDRGAKWHCPCFSTRPGAVLRVHSR